jgi:transposase-like protein
MTPAALARIRRRGYHHDPDIAALAGVPHRPSQGAWVYDVAQALGVSPRAVYRWIERDRIPEPHCSRAVIIGARVVVAPVVKESLTTQPTEEAP